MSSQFLSDKQRAEYKLLHKTCKKRSHADRIKAILLLDQGYTYTEMAKILLLDDSTIRDWKRRYDQEGINFCHTYRYKPRSSKLSLEQEKRLSEELNSKVFLSSMAVANFIEREFKIQYTSSGVCCLLSRLGYVYVKPKPVPAKSDLAAQKKFVEDYEQLLAQKDKEDRIWFIDAVHPMHNAQLAYGWFAKGKIPSLPTNSGRQRLNINGAYNPENQDCVFRKDETINSCSTISLIEQIQVKQSRGKIILIADNVRYNHSKQIKEYLEKNPRVTMIYLPAYSPNLNLIERLWGFARK